MNQSFLDRWVTIITSCRSSNFGRNVLVALLCLQILEDERKKIREQAKKRPIPKIIIYIPHEIAQQIYSLPTQPTKRKYDTMSNSNKTTATKKQKKTSAKASTTPTTVLDKIVVAIRSQTPSSEKGVSRTAIAKYLQTHYNFKNNTALKRALQNAVTANTLIQTGQSFRVTGDPVVTIPTVQVTIEDLIVQKDNTEAKVGDTVTVQYKGKLDDGTVFDSANSFSFTLGAGDVIKGKS